MTQCTLTHKLLRSHVRYHVGHDTPLLGVAWNEFFVVPFTLLALRIRGKFIHFI